MTDVTEFRLSDDPMNACLSLLASLFGGPVSFSVGPSPSKALIAEILGGVAGSVRTGRVKRSDRGRCFRMPDWVVWREHFTHYVWFHSPYGFEYGVVSGVGEKKRFWSERACADHFDLALQLSMFRSRRWGLIWL